MTTMREAAVQLTEPRRPVAANPPAEAPAWSKVVVDAGDYCVVIPTPVAVSRPSLDLAGLPAPRGGTAELWQRDDFCAELQSLVQLCADGEEQHYEAAYELARAGRRRFEINLYPGHTPGPAHVVLVIRDITERRRAESHLQLLLQIVHFLSVSPDLSFAATSILKRLCAVSNWPLGELWTPNPEGAVELFSAAHRPDLAGGEQFRRDTAGLTLPINEGLLADLWSGSSVYIADLTTDATFLRAAAAARAGFRSAFAIPLKSGEQTLGVMLFFLTGDKPPDQHWMTLAHAVAAELGAVFHRVRMQEQLDSFFNRSLDMHCLAGSDGFLKRVNPAWTRTLGYDTEELLSRPLIEFVHPEDRSVFRENLSKLGQGEDLTAVEVRCLCKDGSPKWTLWNATPLPNQDLVIATGRDITERKHTEAAVLRSEEHYRDLFHQAYQMQENLRRLSDRVLKVQEQERSRISRDLHDEVGQALTAINMNLAILRNTFASSPVETERRLRDSQDLIERTMETIHDFSRELRPAMLDDLGLLPALRNYVTSFTERTGIAVQLHATQSENIEQLDSERKTVVYRIVQEGLNNVAKHADAKRVEIVIAGSHYDVRLQLGDDGQGFSPGSTSPASAPKQLGLLGLAERVRLVGGEFALTSMPDHGTILRATIPFKSV